MLCLDEMIPEYAKGVPFSPPGPRFVAEECPSVALARRARTLACDEVHLWHTAHMGCEWDESEFRGLLAKDEIGRMQRFHFPADRRNFLFCRGMLRILLASYLGASPADLLFTYSAHGKPSLATSSGNLEFNLSHSNGHVLIGITRGRKIGVDIECIDRDVKFNELAERFFSPAENREIAILPQQSRRNAFFACWTRKEAILKATGFGLSLPLDSFDVSVGADEEHVKVVSRWDDHRDWIVQSINVWQGYAAAAAVEAASTEPAPF